MNATSILKDALTIIEDGEHWTKGAFARGANDEVLAATDPEAVSWCAVGALVKTTRRLPIEEQDNAFNLLTDASREFYGITISEVNDLRGHEAIVKVFRDAILRSESATL